VSVRAAQTFTDVSEDAWYYDPVEFCYNWGFMNGTGNGMFSPNDTLTRAMAATILYRLLDSPDASGLGNPFSDVPEGQWYSAAIKWMSMMDYVNGYGNGLFGPEDPVTKEQAAVMLYRIINQDDLERAYTTGTTAGVPYQDFDKLSEWAYGAVVTLNDVGIFTYIPGFIFNPQTPATRAEMASMLFGYYVCVFESDEWYGDNNDGSWFAEDAFYIIENLCEETMNLLKKGMTAMWVGDYEIIGGEACWKIALGTDHEEHFVVEFVYAVGEEMGGVFRYDVLTDAWIPVNVG